MSTEDQEREEEFGIMTEDETELQEPRMYKIILLNDNYTTMDFVVLVLEHIFKKTPSEAQQIMLNVHEKGSGVAGVYTKDVAETKIALVHQLAQTNEYPLKCAMEPE